MSEKRVIRYVVKWEVDGSPVEIDAPTRKEAWKYYWNLGYKAKNPRVIRVVAKPRRDTTVETLKWCYALCDSRKDIMELAKVIEMKLKAIGAWEDEQ